MNRLWRMCLCIALLIIAVLQLTWLGARAIRRQARQFPAIDLTLLGDQVSRQALRSRRESLDPRNSDDWQELGEFCFSFGYYPQAELCFRVAQQMAPHNRELWLLQALCLDRMGAKREAVEQYQRAIELRASGAEDYRLRIAQCWLSAGEQVRALNELRRLNSRPDAMLLLCRLLARSGKTSEAQAILRQLQVNYPHSIEPFSMDSWIQEGLDNEAAAYQLRSRALRSAGNLMSHMLIRPADVARRRVHSNISHHLRSLELEAAGDIAGARRACRQAAEAMWEEDMILSYALFEIHVDHPEEAINLLNDAIYRVGTSARLLDALGDAWQAKGNDDAARDSWLQSIELQGTPEVHQKLRKLFEQAGDAARARWHLGLENYESGKLAWLSNEVSQAKEFFQLATQHAPGHAHSWYYLAESSRVAGDNTTARAAYQRCLKLNPDHGRAYHALNRMDSP